MRGIWTSSVPELGKQYFVINNLDKSSGFINVSYSGDPGRRIDCGRMTAYVKNAQSSEVDQPEVTQIRTWSAHGGSA